ncbi:hypothetical protein V5799_018163 [Amblyomma americanum]|uniref:Uncharacterized protein n=1 Tax=Amblyomma americanum TaxID=6943 RepID=A0AAQ4F063_AMBAM
MLPTLEQSTLLNMENQIVSMTMEQLLAIGVPDAAFDINNLNDLLVLSIPEETFQVQMPTTTSAPPQSSSQDTQVRPPILASSASPKPPSSEESHEVPTPVSASLQQSPFEETLEAPTLMQEPPSEETTEALATKPTPSEETPKAPIPMTTSLLQPPSEETPEEPALMQTSEETPEVLAASPMSVSPQQPSLEEITEEPALMQTSEVLAESPVPASTLPPLSDETPESREPVSEPFRNDVQRAKELFQYTRKHFPSRRPRRIPRKSTAYLKNRNDYVVDDFI